MAPDDITPEPDGNESKPSETYEYVEEVVEYKDTRGIRTLLAVLLALLLLLLVGVSYVLWSSSQVIGGPSGASKGGSGKMVWVRSIYGWGTASDQQLMSPNAVAFAPDGTIWSNSGNRLAVAFTPQGRLDRLLMSKPETSTSEGTTGTAKPPGHTGAKPSPRGKPTGVSAVFSVDVDSNNALYIGDDAEGNVLKFTPEGRLVSGWSVPGLVKMAANSSRVAAVTRGSLGVFDQGTGSPVFDFGTRGQGTNQFDMPIGVHVDDKGFVYVADTQNQRVLKYTPSGRQVWSAGTVPDRKFQPHVGAPKGIFQLPTGVTTDANGRVVVADAFNYNIVVLDGTTGKKIASYGEYGQNDGQFDNPSAISYDRAHDYFVVADTNNNRLQVVRIPGSGGALTPGVLMSRTFSNPAWVFCLPPLILLLAILVTYVLSRRRKTDDEAVEEPAE